MKILFALILLSLIGYAVCLIVTSIYQFVTASILKLNGFFSEIFPSLKPYHQSEEFKRDSRMLQFIKGSIELQNKRRLNEKTEILINVFTSLNVQNYLVQKFSGYEVTSNVLRNEIVDILIRVTLWQNNQDATQDLNEYLLDNYDIGKHSNLRYISNFVDSEISKYRRTCEEKTLLNRMKQKASIDCMTGIEFEQFIQKLFVAKGIVCETTPASGDYGADLIVYHNGKKLAIQCKRYKNTVGFDAIKEALTGKAYYGCDTAWVVTNSTFTRQAIEASKKLNVILVHIDDLIEMVA